MGIQIDRVRFNVRGKIFETSATTLAPVSRSSMLGAMLDYEWNQQPAEGNKEYFIDRDPDCFNVLLNLLGTGELHVPPNVPEKLLYREAHYYGLLDHVRSAKICKFNFNWLKLERSVRDKAPCNLAGQWTTIRASPDGGCAVAQDRVVRLYNWMLEERPPINLDFKKVCGIEWIDSENIVMGCQNISRGVGGMGVFSSSAGELRHRLHLNDEKDEVNNFAEALCFDYDRKIFASWRGISSSGIGEWDLETGKQSDFFNLSLDSTAKFQWLNGRNCLFVNNRIRAADYKYSFEHRRCINLLDFRDKSTVWSMCMDDGTLGDNNYIVDAIPMEDSNSICVVSRMGNLGFVDLRSTNKSVTWKNLGGHVVVRRPKLILHGGQLYSCLNDMISVYHGGLDQWVLTSSLRNILGPIQDFSIGGDRLFALRSEENVFDVWETPSAPII